MTGLLYTANKKGLERKLCVDYFKRFALFSLASPLHSSDFGSDRCGLVYATGRQGTYLLVR
jgi:hypothetical protein